MKSPYIMNICYQEDGYKYIRLSIRRWFYLRPSIYQYPFLSIRWLCFEFIHQSNPIGVDMGGFTRVK